jgi:hypothetical protein
MRKRGALRRIGLAIGFGLAILFAPAGPSGLALAQGTPEERSACTGDALQFCSTDIPTVPAIEACLRRNESALSPECRAEFHPTGRTRLNAEHFR